MPRCGLFCPLAVGIPNNLLVRHPRFRGNDAVEVFGDSSGFHSRFTALGATPMTQFHYKAVSEAGEALQGQMEAGSVEEVLRLQTEYVKAQVHALNEQTKELAEATARIAKDTTQPK